jgi:hypothetical protein
MTEEIVTIEETVMTEEIVTIEETVMTEETAMTEETEKTGTAKRDSGTKGIKEVTTIGIGGIEEDAE